MTAPSSLTAGQLLDCIWEAMNNPILKHDPLQALYQEVFKRNHREAAALEAEPVTHDERPRCPICNSLASWLDNTWVCEQSGAQLSSVEVPGRPHAAPLPTAEPAKALREHWRCTACHWSGEHKPTCPNKNCGIYLTPTSPHGVSEPVGRGKFDHERTSEQSPQGDVGDGGGESRRATGLDGQVAEAGGTPAPEKSKVERLALDDTPSVASVVTPVDTVLHAKPRSDKGGLSADGLSSADVAHGPSPISPVPAPPSPQQSAGQEVCALCETPVKIAPGIGPYCPNLACKNVDGPTKFIPAASQGAGAGPGGWYTHTASLGRLWLPDGHYIGGKRVEHEVEKPAGHGEPCSICGKPCDALTGDATLWPLYFPDADQFGTGHGRYHHSGCVAGKLAATPTPAQAGTPTNRPVCAGCGARRGDPACSVCGDEAQREALKTLAAMSAPLPTVGDDEALVKRLGGYKRFANDITDTSGVPVLHCCGGEINNIRAIVDDLHASAQRIRELQDDLQGMADGREKNFARAISAEERIREQAAKLVEEEKAGFAMSAEIEVLRNEAETLSRSLAEKDAEIERRESIASLRGVRAGIRAAQTLFERDADAPKWCAHLFAKLDASAIAGAHSSDDISDDELWYRMGLNATRNATP